VPTARSSPPFFFRHSARETTLESQTRSELGIARLARIEKFAGKFAKAAVYYESIAGNSRAFATEAYYSAGAGGEVQQATRLRQQFGLNIANECPLCLQAEDAINHHVDNGNARDSFKALCIVKALANL
jgi:hypothetical protein